MRSFLYDYLGVFIGLMFGAALVLFAACVVDFALGTRLVHWLYHSNRGPLVLIAFGAAMVTYLVRRGEIGSR
jgi:hypothetical protein